MRQGSIPGFASLRRERREQRRSKSKSVLVFFLEIHTLTVGVVEAKSCLSGRSLFSVGNPKQIHQDGSGDHRDHAPFQTGCIAFAAISSRSSYRQGRHCEPQRWNTVSSPAKKLTRGPPAPHAQLSAHRRLLRSTQSPVTNQCRVHL